MDFHNLSSQERLLVEHVLLLNREVRTACQDAPYGHVLDAGEQATLAAMKKIGKLLLETNLQEHIDAAETQETHCKKCSKKKRRTDATGVKSSR